MNLADSLGRSPELFPHALDVGGDAVTFIRLTREDYLRASFLDARVLTPDIRRTVLPWSDVSAAVEAAHLPESCGYLFHIGHVGSTLLSRLVGAHPAVFSVREPLVLREFAGFRSDPRSMGAGWSGDDYELRLGGCLRLLSRTYEKGTLAIVKATSFVSEIAAELMQREAAPKAVAVLVSPESYLATMFGGPNSRKEAQLLAPARLQRLHRYVDHQAWDLTSLGEGQLLALSWACETAALARIPRHRILCLDFDRFLKDPTAGIAAVLRQFDIATLEHEVAAILRGPDMQRYSKAPEYAYDAALRREVLDDARRVHNREILQGLQWLERAAARFAPIRDALAFASSAAP